MPKRSRTPKADPNVAAFDALHQLMQKAEAERKDPLAVALGRRGGLKGGHARAAALSPSQRRESARKAAVARWKKR